MENMPEQTESLLAGFTQQAQVTSFDANADLESMKTQVANGEIDLIIIFLRISRKVLTAMKQGRYYS